MADNEFVGTSSKVIEYAQNHSSEELPVLARLRRATHLRTHLPQMLSGYQQGILLQMISCMIKPAYILEIGTFTGYSAICLAQGLQPKGKLITIETNPEMYDFAQPFFAEAGLHSSIEMITGDALQIIQNLDYSFDLVFIDAAKENYKQYFELAFRKVKIGGIILADNTLWYGKVADQTSRSDKETIAMHAFNEFILHHQEVEKLLLPLRDGLTVIRKIK
jgi:predicted O-methyltransferase YrrM